MLFPGSQPFSIAAPQPPLFLFYQSCRLYPLPMRKCHYNICCFFFFFPSIPLPFLFSFDPSGTLGRAFHPAMPTDTKPPGQAATAHLKHGPVNSLTGSLPCTFPQFGFLLWISGSRCSHHPPHTSFGAQITLSQGGNLWASLVMLMHFGCNLHLAKYPNSSSILVSLL